MAANTAPIFPIIGICAPSAVLATADTTTDGDLSGANVRTLATGDTDGTRIDYVKVRATGTNVATVLRLFINNGNTAATAANNALFMERTIAATTASATSELADTVIPLDFVLPSGYKLLATIGTSVSAGLKIVAVGGDFS